MGGLLELRQATTLVRRRLSCAPAYYQAARHSTERTLMSAASSDLGLEEAVLELVVSLVVETGAH